MLISAIFFLPVVLPPPGSNLLKCKSLQSKKKSLKTEKVQQRGCCSTQLGGRRLDVSNVVAKCISMCMFVFFVLRFAMVKIDCTLSWNSCYCIKKKHIFLVLFCLCSISLLRNRYFDLHQTCSFLRFHLWASETLRTSAGWWAPLGKAGPLLQRWWVHIDYW